VPAEKPPEKSPLYGRQREIETLFALIARAKEHGDALVIRGEPGIGKSALLAAASTDARANGFQVLTATGVQSEAELPFAGLDQLTRAIRWDPDSLPDPQRNAVLAAFGKVSSATPDSFLIALATLDLLAEAAASAPILIVAEDAQWLDRPTSDVLTFVARRLESDPIAMLLAVRDDRQSPLLGAGLNELRLIGLSESDAQALLDGRVPQLNVSIRRSVLDEARGNPLALIELPAALQGALGKDRLEPAKPLLLTTRLETAFSSRYLELPPPTRTVLLAAALDDESDLSEVLAAASVASGGTITADALTPATASRLIEVDQNEIRFRHPLIRSAIRQSASLSERLAGHAALAAGLGHEPDRRAWHLASSVIGRDEDVAIQLDELASKARARGAAAVSVTALERAAELSPDPVRRVERLLRAAELAFEVGRRDLVVRIVHDVEPLTAIAQGPLEMARLTLIRGLGEPRVLSAERLGDLVAIARRASEAGDGNLCWNVLWRAAQRCFWADPGPEARNIVVRAAEEADPDRHEPRLVAVLAYAAPLERANIVIDLISRWSSDTEDAETARLLGSAAVVVGAFDLSARFLAQASAGLRTQGRLAHLARSLAMQGWSATCLADWKVAIPALDEAVRLASETGEAVWGAGAQALRAILAAVHGEPDVAARLALEAERAVLTAGATHMLAYVQVARGLTALGEGRHARAYDELRRIFDPADPAHHNVPCCWYIGELAEAAARSGHKDDARGYLTELEPLIEGTNSSWIQGAFLYAHAQLATDRDAEVVYKRALDAHAVQWPFQRARLNLAYGAWLRRQRRIKEARTALRAARDAFDALDVAPWAGRARQELRAAGEASPKRSQATWDQLSAQEMQIAAMAAEGLSNREIGQRLYLSHRTVGSHLYRAFPKLGVTSRSQLVAALAKG
jgi:DNA-binding CsgD family transcriptional regulator